MRVLSVSLVLALGLLGCNRTQATPDDAGAPAVKAATADTPPPPSPLERIQAAPNLATAFKLAEPDMVDNPNDIGKGTILLAGWAARSMTWTDVGVVQDDTSYALVMKDADEARGKRMCVPGNIIQIEVAKLDFGKVTSGLIMSDAGNLYEFVGVCSSGTLVEHNRARFCGVVTGRYDYSNSGGGTGHAVKLVGMFDLPENRSANLSPAIGK